MVNYKFPCWKMKHDESFYILDITINDKYKLKNNLSKYKFILSIRTWS